MPKPSWSVYSEIARFFIPLSLTSLIIQLSHSVVNAGVARTPNPEIALAAYALAMSFVRLIENPMFMVRQTVVSLVKNKQSLTEVSTFVFRMAALITLVLALSGFTPLGHWLLTRVMGASNEIAQQAHLALRVLFLLPFAAAIRNMYHGIAIMSRQTVLLPASTALRLIVMSVVIFVLALGTELPGALSASISFVCAFIVEALIMRWRARPLLLQGVFHGARTRHNIDQRGIGRFFWPLMLTTFVATAFGPLVNAGLARTVRPEVALAGFAVGHALGMLLMAPLGMLHQCTLAFTKLGDRESYRTTGRFVGGLVILAIIVLGTISFSPVGDWLLHNVMGLSGAVAEAALAVMQVMTLLPVFLGWREYLWGILMQQRVTTLIGSAKALNLVVVIAVLVVLLTTGWSHPAAAGAWALVLGEFSECLYIQQRYRKTSIYQQLQ